LRPMAASSFSAKVMGIASFGTEQGLPNTLADRRIIFDIPSTIGR
jgi:hypothetical protein